MSGKLKKEIQLLKIKTHALFLAYKHPGTPWYAKALAACVAAYALSPIDLIPDFIPVIGHLDDLVIVPLGIYLAIKMIPRPIWEECLAEAQNVSNHIKSKNRITGGIIIIIWLLLFVLIIIIAVRYL